MSHCPRLIHTLLHGLGILRLLISSQRNRITILMLHGVVDPSVPTAWNPLRPQHTVKQLEATLNILDKYYQFVSLSNAVDMLSGSTPPVSNSLVLTFDDGYRNNLNHAMPVLRRFKAPATIYLSTGNVTEQNPFWFDRLDFAIQTIENDVPAQQKIPELSQIDFSNRDAMARSFVTFIRRAKKRYSTDDEMYAAMEGLADRLEQLSGKGLKAIFADDPWSGILNWGEVQRCAGVEIEFGSHGVYHKVLNRITPDVAMQELTASREAIAFHTKHPCLHLAYPNGDFSQEVISLAKTCGYVSAVTTITGLNGLGRDLFSLRRIPSPRSETPTEIIAAVSKNSIL